MAVGGEAHRSPTGMDSSSRRTATRSQPHFAAVSAAGTTKVGLARRHPARFDLDLDAPLAAVRSVCWARSKQ